MVLFAGFGVLYVLCNSMLIPLLLPSRAVHCHHRLPLKPFQTSRSPSFLNETRRSIARCAAEEEVFAVVAAVSRRGAGICSVSVTPDRFAGGVMLTTILASLEAFYSFSSSTASQKLRRLRGNAESPADFTRSTGEAVSSTVEEIELSTLGAMKAALGGVALTGGKAECGHLEWKSVGMVATIGKSAKN